MAFTVTSHIASCGRPATAVDKTLLASGLSVYFDRICSLFSFILLTYKIMIMFYIMCGVQ